MLDLNEIKIPYWYSILIIVLVIIIVIYIYKTYIEGFVKIKTNQCDDCKLVGNEKNSYLNIYKESLKNSFKDIF